MSCVNVVSDDTIKCLFQGSEHCNCIGGSDNLKVLSDARLATIAAKSKKRNDDLHTRFKSLPHTIIIKAHEASTSRYTSEYHIDKFLKRKKRLSIENVPLKKTRRTSGASTFVWKLHCLFCGKLCPVVKDPKHPDRWRPASVCRTSDRGPNKKKYKDYLWEVMIFDGTNGWNQRKQAEWWQILVQPLKSTNRSSPLSLQRMLCLDVIAFAITKTLERKLSSRFSRWCLYNIFWTQRLRLRMYWKRRHSSWDYATE